MATLSLKNKATNKPPSWLSRALNPGRIGLLIVGGVVLGALLIATKVMAADLGGNCCADLEERIADLEAKSAQKGNRKVSLTVSGVVNEAIIGWNDGLLGKQDFKVEPNGVNPTRLNFAGTAMISPGYAAGFVIEIAEGSFDVLTNALAVNTQEQVYTRQAAVWVSSPMGKVTLGKTAEATYRIADTSVANVHDSDEMLSLCPLLGCSGITQNVDLYSGQFLNVLRYDSPVFAGFTVSASWSADGTFPGSGLKPQDVWDVAVRWSGEPTPAWKLSASAGYRNGAVFQGLAPILPLPVVAFDQRTLSGSASAMYVPMGAFVDVAAGEAQFGSGSNNTIKSWEVRPGVEERWFKVGKTTLYASLMEMKIDGVSNTPKMYGAGVVQAIDAAAMNLYANWHHIDTDGLTSTSADTYVLGAAVHF